MEKEKSKEPEDSTFDHTQKSSDKEAIIKNEDLVEKINSRYKKFRGATFSVVFPTAFEANPSLKTNTSGAAYESAFFVSPNQSVEFYAFVPVESKIASDIEFDKRVEKITNQRQNKKTNTSWVAYQAKDKSYTRTYKISKDKNGNVIQIVGMKFSDMGAYKKYEEEYKKFKKSLKLKEMVKAESSTINIPKEGEIIDAWNKVVSAYKRRADLISNLIATVKRQTGFDKGTLERVFQARAKATSVDVAPTKLTAKKVSEFQQAQGQLNSALGRLLITVERYPELKANDDFQKIQMQLEGTENRIKIVRDDYNKVVMANNKPKLKFTRSGNSEHTPKIRF